MRQHDQTIRQVTQLKRAADDLETRAKRMRVRGPTDRRRSTASHPPDLMTDVDCDIKLDTTILTHAVDREIAEPLRDDIAGYLNRVAVSLRHRASELLRPKAEEVVETETVVASGEVDLSELDGNETHTDSGQ